MQNSNSYQNPRLDFLSYVFRINGLALLNGGPFHKAWLLVSTTNSWNFLHVQRVLHATDVWTIDLSLLPAWAINAHQLMRATYITYIFIFERGGGGVIVRRREGK